MDLQLFMFSKAAKGFELMKIELFQRQKQQQQQLNDCLLAVGSGNNFSHSRALLINLSLPMHEVAST